MLFHTKVLHGNCVLDPPELVNLEKGGPLKALLAFAAHIIENQLKPVSVLRGAVVRLTLQGRPTLRRVLGCKERGSHLELELEVRQGEGGRGPRLLLTCKGLLAGTATMLLPRDRLSTGVPAIMERQRLLLLQAGAALCVQWVLCTSKLLLCPATHRFDHFAWEQVRL
jgi:hypothetical protein